MININKSDEINAPIENIFQFLIDPEKVKIYLPNVFNIRNISLSDKKIGDMFIAELMVMDFKFEEMFMFSNYRQMEEVSLNFDGVINGYLQFVLKRNRKDVTNLNLKVEYRISNDVLNNPIDNILFQRLNTANFERVLENIKLITETNFILESSKIFVYRNKLIQNLQA